MQIALLQLSDIHIKHPRSKNPLLGRHAQLASAISQATDRADYILVLITGDTAYSGRVEEYDLAQDFLTTLMQKVVPGTPPTVLVIPGNHDCDFSNPKALRTHLLSTIGANEIDDSVIQAMTDPQTAYFRFADSNNPVSHSSPRTPVDRLHEVAYFELGGKSFCVHLLNSAWVSQLHEEPGKMFFPASVATDRFSIGSESDLVISAVHHPFNWYDPVNSKRFRELVESSSDVILTGHEHVSKDYENRDRREKATRNYVEGGVLQDSDDGENSSFNVIKIDLDSSKWQSILMQWSSDRYVVSHRSEWTTFIRNKLRERGRFVISDEFASDLDDPGATYSHPLKSSLSLADIFVYPDLESDQSQKNQPGSKIVKGPDTLRELIRAGQSLIVGDDKAGKTALARMLFRGLHESGRVPIFLNGESLCKLDSDDRFDRVVEDAVRQQYSNPDIDKYLQLAKASRALIVDDFHRCTFNFRLCDANLKRILHRFDAVVLIAAEEIQLSAAIDPTRSDTLLLDFSQYRILPFGFVLRSDLICKWKAIGSPIESDDRSGRSIVQTENLVSRVISRDFVPAYPAYLLILLQRLENSQPLGPIGSFGYLYEVLVTESLSRRKSTEIDAKYNYLTEFAFHLHQNGSKSLEVEQVRAWHATYCSTYHLPIDFTAFWEELVEAGVATNRHGYLQFKYKYFYFFFVARYIRDHINENESQLQIRWHSERLYRDDSANIMLFLCHLSKDDRILGAMLDAARSIFAGDRQFDAGSQCKLFQDFDSCFPDLKLDSDPSENRRRDLESRDEISRNQEADSVDPEAETSQSPAAEVCERLRHIAAAKTIQILGQVLKNFVGSLKGDSKKQLISECCSLGRRTLGNLFESVESNVDGWLELYLEHCRRDSSTSQDKSPLDEAKLRQGVYWVVFALLQGIAFLIIKHISSSVGTDKSPQTLAELVDEEDSATMRLIELAIRLDHYKSFPLREVERLAEEFKRNAFSLSLVRFLVWNHCYLYPVEFQTKQSVCTTLQISFEGQTRLLANRPKRFRSSRGRKPKKKRPRKS